MASPQLKNGYTKISNEIMDELVKIRIPGQARQILDYILRKTYGWDKKEDTISLSQFKYGTNLPKVTICKSINKLLEMNLIIKKGNALSLFTQKGNNDSIIYCFQKNYKKWIALPKKVTLPKKVITVTQKGNTPLPKKVHTIETLKRRKEKEKKIYNNNILLTDDQYNKLIKCYGESWTKAAIDKLDTYIPNRKGAPYKCHYSAMLNWVFDSVGAQFEYWLKMQNRFKELQEQKQNGQTDFEIIKYMNQHEQYSHQRLKELVKSIGKENLTGFKENVNEGN